MALRKTHQGAAKSEANQLSRRTNAAEPNAVKNHQPAKDFRQLIGLVRATEEQLIANGYDDVEERIHVIRGIYYGTTWSADYQGEKSLVRNLGFQTYTNSSVPDDPRPFLKNNLFESMRQSRDVQEGDRYVDFSHLIIGMDARRSRIARNMAVPMQGGTGLELSTWLGDLGGAAGMLARDRSTSPSSSVLKRFIGLDFGGSNNLEGDVAGYVVARDKSDDKGSSALDISKGKWVADALEEYMSPGRPGSEWKDRCTVFLKMMGGEFKGYKLGNRDALIARLAVQIAEFGSVYLLNRLRQKNQLTASLLEASYLHLVGAAMEVAQVFVSALVYSHEHQGGRLQARPPAPPVTPKAQQVTVGSTLLSTIKSKENVEKGAKKIEKDLQEVEHWLKKHLGF
ncbi:hypothetical protein [Corallococcus sp. CA049B]|uniref:hypothetical protein n=1 Tax=Corallococcus sp. CA049B TaxID=2316730 RepID=UPI001F219E56|nr:hypothetical protein [Corallococcus sp. CA049B]